MRNRPTSSLDHKNAEAKFIEAASEHSHEAATVKEDFHHYVSKAHWPLDNTYPDPSLATGGTLKKPLLLYITEQEWNSIERHIKAIGISKQRWLKHAFYKLLNEEQMHFFKSK